MKISPELSADLAQKAYAVRSEFGLQALLKNPIFSGSINHKQSFMATVGTRLINTRDGFCVAARGGSGSGHEKELFLLFRGSTTGNYGADWFSNARCGVQSSIGGLVHVGFSHIFNSMRREIERFISKQITDRVNPVQTIHCIGHSLGGAVATLAANWVKRTTHKHVMLYTFGAPKPGFEGFAKGLTTQLGPDNVHRMYHTTDPVPMVPLYPFVHPPLPGYGHCKGSAEALLFAGAHDIQKYLQSAKGLTWKAIQSPPPVSGFDKVVEKWLESDGSLNPLSSDTWTWINAGLEYVLKKILGTAASLVQGAITSGFSLADKIAWILHKGIDMTIGAGKWVLLLMRKMMKTLQMKVVENVKELTRSLMRLVLERIMEKITAEAKKALQNQIMI